ncbi:MAG: right-handed parallel beta-helix repeat-containing protein [Spirochaetes bacterium]|nr:right-handed parallel beta-helix repeat-containing protein [Spirochaetota bacterium]
MIRIGGNTGVTACNREAALLPLVMFVAAVMSLHGAVVSSNTNTGLTYTNIQSAVTAAAAGQTIVVFEGCYKENITVSAKTNVTLVSYAYMTNGSRTGVVLNGGLLNDTINLIHAVSNRVAGFTVTNGKDAGILIDGTSKWNEVENNILCLNNKWGAAVNSTTAVSNRIVSNEIFSNKTANDANGGIYIADADYTVIDRNLIHHNFNAGIVFINSAVGTLVTGNIIVSNASFGIICNNAAVGYTEVSQNTIGNNSRGFNILNGAAGWLIQSNNIAGNTTGVYLTENGNTIRGNNMISNTIGVDIESVSSTTNAGNLFLANGIAIYINGGSASSIANNIFTNNTNCGVYVLGTALNHAIESNLFTASGSSAIALTVDGVGFTSIRSNIIRGGMSNGIFITLADDNFIECNVISDMIQNGIYIGSGAVNTSISNNIICNTSNGFNLGEGSGVKILRNTLSNNTIGIYYFDNLTFPLTWNNFTNNALHFTNTTGAVICGQTNFWGSIRLPTVMNSIGGIIDTNQYVPYRLGFVGTAQPDITPPPVPSFTAGENRTNSIVLRWTNSAADIGGYRIYRAFSDTWTNFTTYYADIPTDLTTMCWTDTAVDTNFTNFYFVTAYDTNTNAGQFINESWFSESYYVSMPVWNTNTGVKYRTIQTAVDAAGSGHTIVVFDGIFKENVVLSNMNVTLAAYSFLTNGNRAGVIIDGSLTAAGIRVRNGLSNRVIGFSVTNGKDAGIMVDGASAYNSIENNVVYLNNKWGININGKTAFSNRVVSNEAYSNITAADADSGIQIKDADYTVLYRNYIHHNLNSGIVLTGAATNSIILENTIASNLSYGFYCNNSGAGYTEIISNTIVGNINGIYILAGTAGKLIVSNSIYLNTAGIYLGEDFNTIRHNTIYSNTYGIQINTATYNTNDGNIFFANATGIISANAVTGNIFRSNLFSNNLDNGMYLAGSGTGIKALNNSFITTGTNAFTLAVAAVTVQSNTFEGVGTNGIFITATTAVINDNIIKAAASNGVFVAANANVPLISNNIICNASNGIQLNEGTTAKLICNTISNNTIGVYYTDTLTFMLNWNNFSNNSLHFSNAAGATFTGQTNYWSSITLPIVTSKIGGVTNTNVYVPYRLGWMGTSQADMLPPNRPVFTNAISTNSGVALCWTNNGSDIGGYRIYRSFTNTWTNFTTYYADIPTTATALSWVDTNASSNMTNYYFVTAYDRNTNTGQCINESWFSASSTNGIRLTPAIWVEGITPTALSWINSSPITFSGMASTTNGYLVSVYFSTNATSGYGLVTGTTNWTTNFDVSAFPVTNVIYLVVSNSAGKVLSNFQTNYIDLSAPLTGITNLIAGTIVGGTITIRGTNMDVQSGIQETVITITNTNGTMVFIDGLQNGNEFSNYWDTTGVDDGAYYVYAASINGAGGAANSASTRLIVNNIAPQIAQTNIAQFATKSGVLAFKGYAMNSAAVLDPPAVYFKTNGGTFALVTNGTIFTTNINSTTHPDGTNVFEFITVSSNFKTNYFSQTNIIDNSVPYAAVTNIMSGSVISNTVTYYGTNYENLSSIMALMLYTNGALYTWTNTTPAFELTLDTLLIQNGMLALSLIVSNGVGLTYTNHFTNYITNGSAPFTGITNPAPLTWITNTPVSVEGYASNIFGQMSAIFFSTNATTAYAHTGGTTTNWTTNVDVTGFPVTNIFYVVASNEFYFNATNRQTNYVDLSPPNANITNLEIGAIIGGSMTLRGTNIDIQSGITATWIIISNEIGLTTNLPGLQNGIEFTNIWNTTGTADGVYYASILSSNGAGIETDTAGRMFIVNNIAPIITQTDIAQLTTNTGTIAFAGYATNIAWALDPPAVYFRTNGGTFALVANSVFFTTNIDSSILPDGTNAFEFMAVSSNYKTNYFYQTNIIDNSAPYACITNITAGQIVGGIITIRGTNADLFSGIYNTRIIVTNAGGAVTNIAGMQNGVEFTNSLSTAGITDGKYYVYVTVTNGVGIGTNTASTMFVVNNLAPIIAQTNIAMLTTNRGVLSFQGYATNIVSLLDPPAIYFKTNGGNLALMTNGTVFTTNINSAVLPDGSNSFEFIAVSSNYMTNTFYQTNIIDNSAPFAAVTNYANGCTISNTVVYRGTNYENVSGVTATMLYTNGAFYAWTNTTPAFEFSIDALFFRNGVLPISIIVSNEVGLTYTNNFTNYVTNGSTPFVGITNPSPVTWITNDTITFEGYASNTMGQMTGVFFSTNAVSGYAPAGGTTTNWTTNVTVTGYPVTNVFYVVASNEFYFATTNKQTNYVDLSAPVADITNITAGLIFGGTHTIRGTNVDAQSDIMVTRIIVTNAAGAVTNITGLQNGVEFTNNWDTTGVADGRFFAYVTATNNAGLGTNTTSVQFIVNNLAPVIAQTNIAMMATNRGMMSFIGYSTNIANVIDPPAVYMATNGGAFALITNGTGFTTNVNSTTLPDGTNAFEFIAVSSNGNTNHFYQTNIIDNSPPYAAVTNYVNGSVISNSITYRGTNYENISGVTAMMLYTNGAFFAYTNTSPGFEFTMNTSVFLNGMLPLTLVASNGVGLTYTNYITNYITNGSAPFVAITNPAPMTWITNNTISIQGYASNLSGQMTGIFFSTNVTGGYATAGGTTTNWTTNVTVTGFPITNVWYVVASNEYYFVTTNCRTNFVDLSAPAAGITNITAGQIIGGTYVFRGTNMDVQSGIASTRMIVTNTGGIVTNITGLQNGDEFTNSWNTTGVADGTYFIYLISTNTAGIGTNTAGIAFIVNNLAPVITQTNIAELTTNTGTLAFIGYATNISSIVDPPAVYLATNGGAFALVTNGTGFTTNFNSTSLLDGTNVFTFAAVSSNNRTNFYYQTNVIDNSIPFGAPTNNFNGATIASTIVITGTNYENISAITANVLFTNGAFFAWTNTSPWEFTFDSRLFTNGLLKLALVVSNGVNLVYTNVWTNYVSNVIVASNTNTGTTYTTIQNAVTAAGDGHTVVVFAGAYTENLLISGKTRFSLISHVFLANSNRDGVVLDGNNNAETIKIDSCVSNRIIGFTCINGKETGIYITGTSSYNRIDNNIVRNNERWGINIFSKLARYNLITSNEVYSNTTASENNCGILINDADYSELYKNSIHHNGNSGILIAGNATNSSIHENIINSNVSYGFLCNTGAAGYTEIVTNTIVGNIQGVDILNAGVGMVVASNNICLNSTGILINTPFNAIRNNFIYSNGCGVDIESTSSVSNDGNMFFANGTGIKLNGGSANIFQNNILSSNTNCGIYCLGSGNNNLIQSNRFDTTGSNAISIIDNGMDFTYVRSNVIYGAMSNGIYVVMADNSLIENNIISATAPNGVFIGATADNTTISNNSIYSATRGISLSEGNGANVSCNTLSNNTIGLYYDGASTLLLKLNNLTNNTLHFSNVAAATITAQTNYWGTIRLPVIMNSIGGVTATNQYVPYRLGWVGTAQADMTPPNRPVFTNASNIGAGVVLHWTNNGTDIGGYRIYRAYTNTWTNITTFLADIPTTATAMCWTDANASTNMTNYYFVTAYDTNTNAGQYINESWFSAGSANGVRLISTVTVSITNPAAITWITNNPAYFAGLSSNTFGQITAIYFSTNATTGFALAGGTTTNWTTNVTVTGFPVTNDFYVVASNEYGFVATNHQTNYVDLSAPDVGITNITAGQIIGGTFTFRGTNIDTQSDILATRIMVTNVGGNVTNIIGLQNSIVFTNNWNTAGVSDGMYYAYISATNGAGIGTNTTSVQFIVNNVAPVVAQTNIVQYATNRGLIAFIGYATNTASVLDPPAVYFKTNGGVFALVTNHTVFTTNVDTTTLPDGTNSFEIIAVSSNFKTNACYQTNIIDNSAPFAAVTNYVNGSIISNTITYRGTNHENVSGITAMMLYTNGAFFAYTNTSPGFEFTLNTGVFLNGMLPLTLVASNGVGLAYTNYFTNYITNGSAPFVAITNPAPLTWITNNTISIQGYASNLSGQITAIYFSTNATIGFAPAGGITTNWTTNVTVTGFPVTNVFYAAASNEYYFVTTNCQTNFVDLSAPAVSITNITAGQIIGGMYTIRGTNMDAQSGIAATRIIITNAGGIVTNIAALQIGDEFTNNWNTTGVSDGRYFAYMSSTNSAGIYTNTASTTFIINNLAPMIAQTNIAQYAAKAGSIMFIGYATNAASVLDPPAVYFKTNGGTFTLITYGTIFTTNVDSTTLPDGTNIFEFIAVSSNYRTNRFYQTNLIDNSIPFVSITNSVNGGTVSNTVTYTGTNYDNVTGITVVLYTNGAFYAETNTSPSFIFMLDTTLFTNGMLVLSFVATNSAGLVFTNNFTNYVSNNVTPSAAITNLANGSWITATPATVCGTAAAPFGSITAVYISTNASAGYAAVSGTTAWTTNLDVSLFPVTNAVYTVAVSSMGYAVTNVQTNYIDLTPPAACITNMISGIHVSDTISVRGTNYDAESSIASTHFIISNTAGLITNIYTAVSGNDWSVSWNTRSVSNGVYAFIVRSINGAGAVYYAPAITITVTNHTFHDDGRFVIAPNPYRPNSKNRRQGGGLPYVIVAGVPPSFTLEIYAVDGQMVDKKTDAMGVEGRYQYEIPSRLATGIYLVRIKNGTSEKTTKLTVIR